MIRMVLGLIVGMGVGLVVTVAIVLTKLAPVINTPRAMHGAVLVVLVAVPAVAGALIGAISARRQPEKALLRTPA